MPELPKPVIMGLLQNQYFNNPERASQVMKLYDKYRNQSDCPPRNRFIRDMLFMGCKTGKVLRQIFTWDICADIVWEEVSPKIGGSASSCFPPDEEHILSALKIIQPSIIIAFGKIAGQGLRLPKVWQYMEEAEWDYYGDKRPFPINMIFTCHPAARHPTVLQELKQAADKLQEWITDAIT